MNWGQIIGEAGSAALNSLSSLYGIFGLLVAALLFFNPEIGKLFKKSAEEGFPAIGRWWAVRFLVLWFGWFVVAEIDARFIEEQESFRKARQEFFINEAHAVRDPVQARHPDIPEPVFDPWIVHFGQSISPLHLEVVFEGEITKVWTDVMNISYESSSAPWTGEDDGLLRIELNNVPVGPHYPLILQFYSDTEFEVLDIRRVTR